MNKSALAKMVGENLALARRIHGDLSQTQLAERIGHSDSSAISRWEAGRSLPTLENVVLLCRGLGCEPDFLIGDTEQWNNILDE